MRILIAVLKKEKLVAWGDNTIKMLALLTADQCSISSATHGPVTLSKLILEHRAGWYQKLERKVI